ncbi:hypothetical protein B0J14DRAFT_485168 [Halenospora varia]|nr:hypothetical protein B0J14DRAFT_485168 [Halenospora varia]
MANNNENNGAPDAAGRNRRGSFTSQTFNNIFGGRSNSVAGPTAPFPSAISTGNGAAQDQRRRMSISTLGLSGTSPTQTHPFPFAHRRASVSTANSDSINESAIDDDDSPGHSAPTTPFARRMSFGAQALRRAQPSGSPGTNAVAAAGGATGTVTPPKAQNQAYQASSQSKPRTTSDYTVSARTGESGFNWSEQLRSRAESSVSQSHRPSFSTSPSTTKVPMHERHKSVSEMPTPPVAVPAPAPPQRPARKQPDAFQERILKGDFYMD